MRLKIWTFTVSLLLLIAACGVKQTAEQLWDSSEQALKARKYSRAIKSLETLISAYPDHAITPRAKLQIGDIYMNNMNKIDNSLEAYGEAAENYPNTEEGAKALFMVGFVNANHLQDLGAAEDAYLDFLHRYPNHELIPSVRFELENLGRSIDEIEALQDITNAS
ncbi:tol-pal system YbgF family protein [Candidatus Neomarinimicrobiota bacterium]